MTTELTMFYTQHIPSASGLTPDRVITWRGTLTRSPLWIVVTLTHGNRTITRILPPETELPIIEMLLHDWIKDEDD